MNENCEFSRWELLSEVFGKRYSLPYRLYRLREFFATFESYYENTIIPSIVLTCIAGLQYFLSDVVGIPSMMPDVSIRSFLAVFLIFTSLLSIEPIFVSIRNYINKCLSLEFLD